MRTILLQFLITALMAMPLARSGTAAEIGLSRQAIAGSNPPVMVAAIFIFGQIEDGDAKKVATLIDEAKETGNGYRLLRFIVNSPGGMSGDALQLGSLARLNAAEVFVPAKARCISACVFILAGGATRTIGGEVGIDRPHFLRAAGPKDDLPSLLAEAKQAMRDYFRSMGVAENLADTMFAVPPGEVHLLNHDELIKYRLE